MKFIKYQNALYQYENWGTLGLKHKSKPVSRLTNYYGYGSGTWVSTWFMSVLFTKNVERREKQRMKGDREKDGEW